jgi:hypothetical protein
VRLSRSRSAGFASGFGVSIEGFYKSIVFIRIEDWTFSIFTKGKSLVWRTVKQFALTGRKIIVYDTYKPNSLIRFGFTRPSGQIYDL